MYAWFPNCLSMYKCGWGAASTNNINLYLFANVVWRGSKFIVYFTQTNYYVMHCRLKYLYNGVVRTVHLHLYQFGQFETWSIAVTESYERDVCVVVISIGKNLKATKLFRTNCYYCSDLIDCILAICYEKTTAFGLCNHNDYIQKR